MLLPLPQASHFTAASAVALSPGVMASTPDGKNLVNGTRDLLLRSSASASSVSRHLASQLTNSSGWVANGDVYTNLRGRDEKLVDGKERPRKFRRTKEKTITNRYLPHWYGGQTVPLQCDCRLPYSVGDSVRRRAT